MGRSGSINYVFVHSASSENTPDKGCVELYCALLLNYNKSTHLTHPFPLDQDHRQTLYIFVVPLDLVEGKVSTKSLFSLTTSTLSRSKPPPDRTRWAQTMQHQN